MLPCKALNNCNDTCVITWRVDVDELLHFCFVGLNVRHAYAPEKRLLVMGVQSGPTWAVRFPVKWARKVDPPYGPRTVAGFVARVGLQILMVLSQKARQDGGAGCLRWTISDRFAGPIGTG